MGIAYESAQIISFENLLNFTVVFLNLVIRHPNLASFYVTRLVLTPTLGGGCYFGLDWFYSFH